MKSTPHRASNMETEEVNKPLAKKKTRPMSKSKYMTHEENEDRRKGRGGS